MSCQLRFCRDIWSYSPYGMAPIINFIRLQMLSDFVDLRCQCTRFMIIAEELHCRIGIRIDDRPSESVVN